MQHVTIKTDKIKPGQPATAHGRAWGAWVEVDHQIHTGVHVPVTQHHEANKFIEMMQIATKILEGDVRNILEGDVREN